MLTKCYFSIGTYRDRYGARTMELADRVEQRLKLHDLRVLMTVVQVGSMGKAARELGTSQPAISRAIADLEQMLGVPLLVCFLFCVFAVSFSFLLLPSFCC